MRCVGYFRHVITFEGAMRLKQIKISVLWGIVALLMSFSSPAAAQSVIRPHVLNGYCEPNSWLGGSSPGTSLRNGKTRFFCDAAVVAFFDTSRSHLVIQFVGTRRNHGQIIGFAGIIGSDGLMNVSRLYLEIGRPIPVSDGVCRIFRQRQTITSIMCGNRVETGPRSIVPTVVFTARN